jgi:hypothetical protein
VKNSFIHIDGGGTCRKRTYSAPAVITEKEDEPLILEADHEAPIIQFRGDIFYSIFVSPSCERPPAKLPPGTTTVMVRNIPTRFTSVSFLRVLDECGFRDAYSFFYLPVCLFLSSSQF